MSRRKARVDDNQASIVALLRSVGASVQSLAGVGHGCPDLLVGFRGRNYLLEIKDGKKPPSARKLTDDQTEWLDDWRGSANVVHSESGALMAIGCRVVGDG